MSECPNFEIQTQTQNIDFQTAFVLFFSFFQRRKKASIYNTWIFTVRSLKKLDPLALFAPCWLISNYKWHLSHNNRRESSHWHDIYLFTCHLLRFLKIHWVLTRYIYIYMMIYMICFVQMDERLSGLLKWFDDYVVGVLAIVKTPMITCQKVICYKWLLVQ